MVANTTNSHRLVEWADQFGKQDALISALFQAYFEDEKNIGDLDVLAEAAGAAGLDAAEAKKFLSSDEGTQHVHDEVKRFMKTYRISGVPFFLVSLHTSTGATDVGDAPVTDAAACAADGTCAVPAKAGATAEPKATSTYTASGAQDVDFLLQLFTHLEGEAAK